MVKANSSIIVTLLLATSLGLFGQDIAYFIDDTIYHTAPYKYLVGATITSILLYLVTIVLIYISGRKNWLDKNTISAYMVITLLIGVFTSLWSVFVTAMWLG